MKWLTDVCRMYCIIFSLHVTMGCRGEVICLLFSKMTSRHSTAFWSNVLQYFLDVVYYIPQLLTTVTALVLTWTDIQVFIFCCKFYIEFVPLLGLQI